MPISTVRLETGIFLTEWSQFITLKDVQSSFIACETQAEFRNDHRYIVILDLRKKQSFPVSLVEYLQMLRSSNRLVGMIALEPCDLSRALGRVLSAQLPYDIISAKTMEQSLELARQMLVQQQDHV